MLTADSIGDDEIAGVSQLSGLSRINSRPKRLPLVQPVVSTTEYIFLLEMKQG
jgi:hypothetical protein